MSMKPHLLETFLATCVSTSHISVNYLLEQIIKKPLNRIKNKITQWSCFLIKDSAPAVLNLCYIADQRNLSSMACI